MARTIKRSQQRKYLVSRMRRTRLLLAPIVALVFTLVISSQFCMPVAGVWPGSGTVTLNNGVISVTHFDSFIGYVQYPVGYNLALWTFGGASPVPSSTTTRSSIPSVTSLLRLPHRPAP